MNYRKSSAALFLSAALLCACQAKTVNPEAPANNTSEIAVQYLRTDDDDAASPREPATVDLSSAVSIALNGTSVQAGGKGVSIENNIITISEGGIYVLSGTLTDGRVEVDAKGSEVTLVLNGADITCSTGSPLYIYKSACTTVHVMEGTENSLTDGNSYTFAGNHFSAEDDEPNACLYSKSDLVIQGAGNLTVNGNYKNGVAGKDTLEIYDAALSVNAVNNGINGKDSNTIDSARITVNCGGDAIRSTNSTDDTLGWVRISNSTLDLTTGEDGIQAETALTISSSYCTILSGGGSTVRPNDDISAKGVKAGTELKLLGGIYHLDCSDDAIHSNGTVSVANGIYTVSSGDDAFHADETLAVSGGQITVLTSYEGLEGAAVEISGGEITVTSSDDGINAGGGCDGSGFGGNGRADTFGSSAHTITISDGSITVNAKGDGLDANGTIAMTGGNLLVSSTSGNRGDGPIDFDSGFTFSGGTLLALGAGGMLSAPTQADQNVLCVGLDTQLQAGEVLTITGDGVEAAYELPIAVSGFVFSSPALKQGASYTISAGDEQAAVVTMTETVTRFGNTTVSFDGMGGKGNRVQDGTMLPDGAEKRQHSAAGDFSEGWQKPMEGENPNIQGSQRNGQKGKPIQQPAI